jgi:UDP-2,3-diacylglucosamine pyrophosphatase LpxH
MKRPPEIVVISDVHLGTYGCRATELCQYLDSVEPGMLILNGDIIDMWQFSKRYWPAAHMQVIRRITGMLSRGVKVYYITGNHDEMLRRFEHFSLGGLHIVNKLVIHHDDNKKSWIFHGDVFDVTMQYSKWLARMGAVGYDMLIALNSVINFCSAKMGYGRISLSKRIKNSVKSAVKYINSFEQTAADIAIQKGYQYVLCGHIHQPGDRILQNEFGSVVYLNSGDWVENLTALEYMQGEWKLYQYQLDSELSNEKSTIFSDENAFLKNKEIFRIMMQDLMTAS